MLWYIQERYRAVTMQGQMRQERRDHSHMALMLPKGAPAYILGTYRWSVEAASRSPFKILSVKIRALSTQILWCKVGASAHGYRVAIRNPNAYPRKRNLLNLDLGVFS